MSIEVEIAKTQGMHSRNSLILINYPNQPTTKIAMKIGDIECLKN